MQLSSLLKRGVYILFLLVISVICEIMMKRMKMRGIINIPPEGVKKKQHALQEVSFISRFRRHCSIVNKKKEK